MPARLSFALMLLLPALAGASGPICKAADPSPQQGPDRVGEEVSVQLQSPGVAGGSGSGPVWRQELTSPGASYIAPHFERFDLPPGARLIVRSPDGRRSRSYGARGKGDLGVEEGFWGMHIPGDTAVIELYASVPLPEGAVRLRGYARGFPVRGESWETPVPEAICGVDDSQWAKCLQGSEPAIYDKSRPVARLLIQGISSCTGWLVGDSGHLLTNAHCIGSAAAAANTDYEFMAEGATCATNCFSSSCPGIIEADSATLVKADFDLDYALVQLPANLTGTYGFLQLRETGAEVDERIYIPGHPQGVAKRIADASTHSTDASGKCEVYSLDEFPCTGDGADVGYFCDTQGGSSGSPVLAYGDHLVVALHHCADCPNRGVPIQAVIEDLGDSLPPNAVGNGCVRPPAPTLAAAPDPGGISLSWTAVAGATEYRLYRSDTAAGPYTLLATTGGTSHLDTDPELRCNRDYHYIVRAFLACLSLPSAETAAASGLCPACSEVSLYSNDFEGSAGTSGWTVGSFLSGSPTEWQGVQACAAQSGSQIFRFGGPACDEAYSINHFDYAWPSPAGEAGLAIPAGAASSRLSFAHRWSFETRYDGGGLMISVDGSPLTPVPATALSGAGYTDISSVSCPPAGAGNLPIFSGEQPSFVATEVDLEEACHTATGSGCAGHSVKLAFVAVSDCVFPLAGWFLDDVAVSSCVVAPAPATAFYTLTPCRLVDTRDADGLLGGPALHTGLRSFTATGACGIPATAKALSLNLTATQPAVPGFLALYPDGWPAAATSAVNFGAGQTRANNTIVGLGLNGAFRVRASGGPVHLIVDVNGYFE